VQNNVRRFLCGMRQITCLAVILFLAGCSDAEKRAVGRNLQEATSKAQRLYAKANSTLSNPKLMGKRGARTIETETLSPDVLRTLDQAEKILTTSLRENYENRKGDVDSLPQKDVAIAKMTLGMVRNLRGQYYIWSTGKALETATSSLNSALTEVSNTEAADSVVFSFQQRIKNSTDSIKELNAKADSINKGKADVVEKKKTRDMKIEAHRDEIAQLEKAIADDSVEASRLKKESSLTTGMESLKKLESALKFEKKIHANRFKIKDIDDKIKVLTGEVDFYQYQITQADYKLTQIDKKRKGWELKASQDREYLQSEILKVESLLKTVAAWQISTGKACETAQKMAEKALIALSAAKKDFSQAAKLKSDKKAQIIGLGGQSNIKIAVLQMTLWDVNRRLDRFVKRAEGVLGQLHVGKPSEAAVGTLKEFIEKTKDSEAAAVTDSKAAVSLKEKAVKAASGDRRWYFQRDLAGAYIIYAQALEVSGKDQEAADVLSKASALLVEIQRKAKTAGESPSVQELKKLIETESGKTS